jgi:hypothetical protein
VYALPGPEGTQVIERWRRTFDPETAAEIAAHVTFIYPEDLPEGAEFTRAVTRAAERTPPFTIGLGAAFIAETPARGVFLRVDDLDGGIATFRSVAQCTDRLIDLPWHVTIVHPRSTSGGDEAWRQLSSARVDDRFTITEVVVSAYDGARWIRAHRLRLGGHADRVDAQ